MQISLSDEQKCIMALYKAGKNVFVTGPGGTGKSHLLRQIVHNANQYSKKIQVCALTGRAAVLLNCRARTIHSWSGIRLAKGPSEQVVEMALKKLEKALRRKFPAPNWKTAEVLVIDEVSMMSRKIFEILDKIARIARKKPDLPFGGLQVLFFGDFYQLSPTPDNGYNSSSDEGSGEYCFESPIWEELFPIENHMKLTRIFRQQNDETFIKILSQVRQGKISRKSHEMLNQRLNAIPPDGICPTKLYPLRASAAALNDKMFNKLESPIVSYNWTVKTNTDTYMDTGDAIEPLILKDCKSLPIDIIESELKMLLSNSPCSEELVLKVGAQVMLGYNLDVDVGLCNGSLGTVIGYTSSSVATTTSANSISTSTSTIASSSSSDPTRGPEFPSFSQYICPKVSNVNAVSPPTPPSPLNQSDPNPAPASAPTPVPPSLKYSPHFPPSAPQSPPEPKTIQCSPSLSNDSHSFPIVRFFNGIVRPISPVSYQSASYPTICFWQIPLKLAWGMTIHSCQGSTLDYAEIDIGSGVFAVGQTYVALSRVKSLDGLFLIAYDPTKIKISKKVLDFYTRYFPK